MIRDALDCFRPPSERGPIPLPCPAAAAGARLRGAAVVPRAQAPTCRTLIECAAEKCRTTHVFRLIHGTLPAGEKSAAARVFGRPPPCRRSPVIVECPPRAVRPQNRGPGMLGIHNFCN